MAEISPQEEDDRHHHHHRCLPEKSQPQISSNSKALAFWAYLTVSVSLLVLLLSSLRSPSSPWILSLPSDLHAHYSSSKPIKAQPFPHRPALTLFAADHRPTTTASESAETVFLLHGLGSCSFSFRRVLRFLAANSIRAVAVDLPGAGFSDLLEEHPGGVFGWFRRVYRDINEKGLFWGFDHIVENGGILFDEMPERTSASEEMGRIISQVINSMALGPVHLVLHDTALEAGASWLLRSPGLVRSVTLIDSAAGMPAFPAGLLGVPVLGEIVLRSRSLFGGLLKLCCSRSIGGVEVEGYRLLLRKKGGRNAVVSAGKRLNASFDVGEWARSEAVDGVPMQVLWSNMWSDRWIDKGRQVAAAIPQAKFAYHSGGRWPQEDAADEIAGLIADFVSSLPKTDRQSTEEPELKLMHATFDKGSNDQDYHHEHHQSLVDGYADGGGYMDNMYGFGQAWWH